jgi:formamidase
MHNRWHPDIAPVVTVAPGDELTLDVEDGIAGLLTRESTHADCAVLDLGLAHPLAGPVEVEGAWPGDVLEVEFLGYTCSDFGVTAVIPGFGFLADRFTDPYLVKWEIEDGVARSSELAGVAVPAEMFAGVVGVAPSMERMTRLRVREERIRDAGGPVADPMPESAVPPSAAEGLRTIPPRETGGNLDIRQLVAGSRLYLPVDVPGALFSIGDLHFAQGDGEVCVMAVEMSATCTVRCTSVRQWYVNSSATEATSTSSAMTPSRPTVNAAAPSPPSRSSPPPGSPVRMSLSTASAGPRASRAARMAPTAERTEPTMSTANAEVGRSSAA